MSIPYKYERKVQEIGNSYMIAIPTIWCKANGIKKGQTLAVEAYEDRIIILKK